MNEVWFTGTRWAARKAGFPGVVFGDTKGEALNRIEGWVWKHHAYAEAPYVVHVRRKRRK